MSGRVSASTGPVPPFVEALRRQRVALGWTQQGLADACGWQRTRIHEYEAGIRALLPRRLQEWAGALDMRVEALPADAPGVEGLLELLACFVHVGDPCRLDHGGCQAHGFPELGPGGVCPHARAVDLLAARGDGGER